MRESFALVKVEVNRAKSTILHNEVVADFPPLRKEPAVSTSIHLAYPPNGMRNVTVEA